jgi:hypothetical protein
MTVTAKSTVRLVNRIDRWLERAGINQRDSTKLSIDLADTLAAADRIRTHLNRMLSSNPRTTLGAHRAFAHAAAIGAWVHPELTFHVARLRRTWPAKLENQLDRHASKRKAGSGRRRRAV